jgi:peptidoglycan/LPS O-acetylase OafA/YrhL
MPDRIQQEIEELLAKLETFPPKRPLRTRVRNGIRGFFRSIGDAVSGVPWPRLSAGHLLLLAIAAIVVFYLAEPGGADVTRWVIAGAFVLFIVAFVMSLRRNAPGGRPTEKLWRGKPMDLHGPGMGDRLRSWWRRRSRR